MSILGLCLIKILIGALIVHVARLLECIEIINTFTIKKKTNVKLCMQVLVFSWC